MLCSATPARPAAAAPRPAAAGSPVPYLCVYASQVAVCIGANRHKKANEALEAMWQRLAPHSFFDALRRNGVKTQDDLANELIRKSDLVRQLVDRSMRACESSAQVAASYESAARELQAAGAAGALRTADVRLADDVVKRNLYTAYGNAQEHRTLRYVRDTLGIDCRPDPTFYKKQCGVTAGGVPWFVGGKIDAITTDRSTVIEIKSRVNRLFHRVPFYETVQVQTYLELLGVEQGALVECLSAAAAAAAATAAAAADADEGPQVNMVCFTRDRDLWTREIVPKLQGFVDFLESLLGDRALQDRYLQSPKRNLLVLDAISLARRRGSWRR